MNSRRLFLITSLAAGCFAVSAASLQINNPNRIHQVSKLQVAKVTAAGHTISAWLADDEGKNQEGMMFLTDKEVKENQGMLFLVPRIQTADQYHAFWMHNTFIPLDIIYIDKDQKVVSIAHGKIKNDTPLVAAKPYFYVLEVKAGVAAKYGIKPGTKFAIPSSLKANY